MRYRGEGGDGLLLTDLFSGAGKLQAQQLI